MLKSSIIFLSILFFCSVICAKQISCNALSHSSPASLAITKTGSEHLVIRTHVTNTLSRELLVDSNGVTLHSEARITPNKYICTGYIKKNQQWVKVKTFTAFKTKSGYVLKESYLNGKTDIVHLYPLTRQQIQVLISAER